MQEERWVMPGHSTKRPHTKSTDDVQRLAERLGFKVRYTHGYRSLTHEMRRQPVLLVGPFVFVKYQPPAKAHDAGA